MQKIIKRNLLTFFRYKENVLYSLMATGVTLMLYFLFLGDAMAEFFAANFPEGVENVRAISSSVILSGMISVTIINACLGGMGTPIMDKEKGIMQDFYTSPVSRSKITLGYIVSSALISLVMTIANILIIVFYLNFLRDVPMLSLETIGLLIVTLFLSVLTATSFAYLITTGIKTTSAFGGITATVGTLSGFLMGVYFPIGQLPDAIQWVIRIFPLSHSAAMFRQVMAAEQLNQIFYGAPYQYQEASRELNLTFGMYFEFGNYTTNFWFSAAYLLASTVIFFGIALLLLARKKSYAK